MSLFGTTPPAADRPTARGLFGDEDYGYGARTSSSLFDDGDDSDKWGFSGSRVSRPRSSTADLVKGLLRGASVPDEYVDLYDDLISEEGEITTLTLRQLLSVSGLADDVQDKILRILGRASFAADDGGPQTPVSRDEFNVFLAFVGLAQEGEEDLTVDAVDDRRRTLPIPNISSSASSTKALAPSIKAVTPSKAPSTPRKAVASPVRDEDTTISASPPANAVAIEPTSTPPPISSTVPMSQSQDDPWGSPEMHVGHNHANKSGSDGLSNSSVTDTPKYGVDHDAHDTVRHTYSSSASQITETDDLQASLRLPRQPTMNAWGGPPSAGGFVDGGTESTSASANRAAGNFGRLGSTLGTGGMRVEELITVTSIPEKEGMFMFQHRNYQIASARRGSRVVRRYSDFTWLLECLHKKYPFRQLPLLPPKRLAVNGHYLSADNAFIERRRRGLARFANALVRHPILREETLVVMFLTVPTELAVWRKQATISVQEEFVDKALPPNLEESLPADLNTTFETVRAGVRRSAEIYIQLCNLLERLEKRQEGISADYRRLSSSISSLTDMSEATYAVDTSEVALLNDGLNSVAKHYSTAQTLLDDEVKAWDEGVLEDLKRHRDSLVSMRELFERKDKYAVDNIPFLEKRITATEHKLKVARAKPAEQLKPNEIERLESSIVADKESIVRQQARNILIKECIKDELVYFQGAQYHVSRCHQDWAQERVKYSELAADNWRSLVNAVEGMPLGE